MSEAVDRRSRLHPALRCAVRNLFSAGLYWAAGKLTLFMAIPPGYATAVWPGAGLALVCVLLWGPRVAPGVALGSFLVNVGTSFDASSAAAIARSVAIAAAIALGAAAEAVLGGALIRRFVGFPTALESEREITRFTLLGGPLSCLVGATAGVTTLCAADVVSRQGALFTWWTWWVGDSIGVLIFAPLSLLVVRGQDALWQQRRAIVGLPLLVGFAVVTVLFLRTSAWDQERQQAEFERRAVPLGHALQARLSEYEDVVSFVASHFEASEHVSREEFRRFSRPALDRHPAIHGLGWNLLVRAADRASVEEEAGKSGLVGFQLKEMDADGRIRPAGPRPEYVPVFYIEPQGKNERALGFDTASDPERREAMRRARKSGRPSATARITLVQETGKQFGVGLLAPVYGGPASGREGRLLGYASGVFRIGDVVRSAIGGLDHQGMEVLVQDVDSPDHGQFLYRAGDPAASAADRPAETAPRWSDTLAFAGRRWTVTISATPNYVAAHRTWQAWILLAGGLLFVGVLGVMSLMTTGRASAAQRMMVEHRRDAVRAIQAEGKFRSTLEAAPTAMLIVDPAGRIVLVNAQVEKLFGYTRDELMDRKVEMLLPERFRVGHPAHRAAFQRAPSSRPMGKGRELFGQRRDGSEVPIEIGLNPLRTSDGDFVLSSIVDITERRDAEAALRENERRFRALVEASAQIVWTSAPAGHVVEDSPSWRAFTGQSFDEWKGWGWLDALHPEDRERTASIWREAVATKTPIDIEYRIRHVSGEWHWTAVRGVPMLDDEARVSGWVGMNTDITERKRAENERIELLHMLQTMNNQLEARVVERTADLSKALKEREVLLQEVHHRVKNNLQVIISLINIQIRKIRNGASKDALEECQTRVQAIALIHEKLYQSKDYARVPFFEYVRSLANSIFHATGVSAGAVELDLAIADIALPVDRAIPCGLILNELITNALKHAFADGRRGTIRVELTRQDDRLRLTVSDTGRGLPPEFDVQKSGSLGLQLVSTLAHQLNAVLETASERGASFTLTFPAKL